MQLPPILQADSITRLLQGAAAGAIATLVIGFYWGGWVLGSTHPQQVRGAEQRHRACAGADLRRRIPAVGGCHRESGGSAESRLVESE